MLLMLLSVRVLMLTTNSHIGKHRATVHTHSHTQFNCNNSALARKKICTSTTHRARRQNKQLRQRQLLFSFARFLSLAPLDLWPPLGSHQRRLHSQASQATRRGRSRRRRPRRRRACQCFWSPFFAGKRRLGLVWYLRTFQCFSSFSFPSFNNAAAFEMVVVCVCMGKTVPNSLELLL